MRKVWLALLFLVFDNGFAQTIASRRYAELTPLQFNFGPFKPFSTYNFAPNFTSVPTTTLQPSSAIIDYNQFTSTGNFTTAEKTDGTSSFSVSGNQGTIGTGSSASSSLLLLSNAATTSVPSLFESVKIVTAGSSSVSADQIILGVSDSNAHNQIRISYDINAHLANIAVVVSGTFSNISSVSFTAAAAPWWMGFSLVNEAVYWWYSTDGSNWTLITNSSVTSKINPNAVDLTTYKTLIGTFSTASTTWVVSDLKTGVLGGTAAPNFAPVLWPDGRPYSIGSLFYFTTGISMPGPSWNGDSVAIFSYDVNSGALTLLGTMGLKAGGSVYATIVNMIYDPVSGTERATASIWPNNTPTTWYVTQNIATDDWLSSSVHLHITPTATQLTLPNATNPYDAFLVCQAWNYSAGTCGDWLISYTALDGNSGNAMYPRMAHSASDPSANSWTAILNDTATTLYEGSQITRTATGSNGAAYTSVFTGLTNAFGSNQLKYARALSQGGSFRGLLNAPHPAGARLPFHSAMFAYGNTEYLIEYNNSFYGTNGTSGDYALGISGISTALKYGAQTNWPTLKNIGEQFSGSTSITTQSLSVGQYSSTISVAVGDLIVGMCRGNANPPGSWRFSDNLSNTYTCLGTQNASGNTTYDNACYTFATHAGTATFTCSGGNSAPFSGLTFAQFSPGFLTQADSAMAYSNVAGPSLTYTSSAFSTTAKGLVVVCPDALFGATEFTPGTIGPYLASFGTGLITGAAPCMGTLTEGAQTNITATMGHRNSATGTWGGAILSFK